MKHRSLSSTVLIPGFSPNVKNVKITYFPCNFICLFLLSWFLNRLFLFTEPDCMFLYIGQE